jgi:hypothetical protein
VDIFFIRVEIICMVTIGGDVPFRSVTCFDPIYFLGATLAIDLEYSCFDIEMKSCC